MYGEGRNADSGRRPTQGGVVRVGFEDEGTEVARVCVVQNPANIWEG